MSSQVIEETRSDAPEPARVHARSALAHTQGFVQDRQNSIVQQLNANSHLAHSEAEASQRSLTIPQETRDRREAQTGTLPGAQADKPQANKPNRVINNAQHQKNYDKFLARSEGGPATGDVAVDECYDGFGATFKFYNDILNRNSINGAGMRIVGTVHFLTGYNNAQWDGVRMIFGDGDGILFNRFTGSLDIIGHELTHGVTQHTATLVYQGESGALNESMSDVFGSMIKQYQLNQTSAEADWLIGAGLFTSEVKATALRSMKAPGTAYDDPKIGGKDPQLANYADVLAAALPLDKDHGGVHIYSGVPNRAFYLVATELGGHSWDRAGKIWWATLTDRRLAPTSNFQQFAKLSIVHAEGMYDESVKTVVENAWKEVGVDTGAKAKVEPEPHAEDV